MADILPAKRVSVGSSWTGDLVCTSSWAVVTSVALGKRVWRVSDSSGNGVPAWWGLDGFVDVSSSVRLLDRASWDVEGCSCAFRTILVLWASISSVSDSPLVWPRDNSVASDRGDVLVAKVSLGALLKDEICVTRSFRGAVGSRGAVRAVVSALGRVLLCGARQRPHVDTLNLVSWRRTVRSGGTHIAVSGNCAVVVVVAGWALDGISFGHRHSWAVVSLTTSTALIHRMEASIVAIVTGWAGVLVFLVGAFRTVVSFRANCLASASIAV